jgi:hypothetical protein
MERLLLVDGARQPSWPWGPRLHRVTDDYGKTWRRAKSPPAPMLTAIDFLDDSWVAVGPRFGDPAHHDAARWTRLLRRLGQRRCWTCSHIQKDSRSRWGVQYCETDGRAGPRKITQTTSTLTHPRAGRKLLILGEAGDPASTDWGKTWTPRIALQGFVLRRDRRRGWRGARLRHARTIFRSKDKGRDVDRRQRLTARLSEAKASDGSIVSRGSGMLLAAATTANLQPIQTHDPRAAKAVRAPRRVCCWEKAGRAGIRRAADR